MLSNRAAGSNGRYIVSEEQSGEYHTPFTTRNLDTHHIDYKNVV
jgi:hypothetical protein